MSRAPGTVPPAAIHPAPAGPMLTDDEVQQLLADPRLCRPYDLARSVEAVLLDKLRQAGRAEATTT